MRNRCALAARLAIIPAVALAVALLWPGGQHRATTAPRLAAFGGEAEGKIRFPKQAHVTLSGGRAFAAGRSVSASSSTSSLIFGQPTIAGINGVGFEAALRLDPSNPNRMYESAPGSLSS